MEVTSNNIANANTVGFKKSRANFSDIYANNLLSQNQGIGVRVSSVQQLFIAGSVELTDRALDLSINSDGFFQLRDPVSGRLSYTRDGHFLTDKNGFVTSEDGKHVRGFAYDSSGTKASSLSDIQIPTSNDPPKATTTFQLDMNLDAGTATGDTFSTTSSVFDSLGNEIGLTLTFTKSAAANTWTVAGSIPASAGTGVTLSDTTLVFNSSGNLTTPAADSSITMTLTNGATTPQSFTWDLYPASGVSYLTQFAATSEVDSVSQDGYPTGTASTVTVDDQGILSVNFSNGQTRPIAQFAVAQFVAPEGLKPISNDQWLETFDSGAPSISSDNASGTIQSEALELSNVDLTEELVRLLTAQRLFQANSQAIQVAERTLDVILNIVQ